MATAKHCLLCNSSALATQKLRDGSLYHHCHDCRYCFQDPSQWPSLLEEIRHYQTHNNDPRDPRYCAYLRQSSQLLIDHKSAQQQRLLDYGCGPQATMPFVWGDEFKQIDAYDPLFYPDRSQLATHYDAITCIEAIEHFFRITESLQDVDRLCNAGSLILFRSEFYEESKDLESWWYRRDPTHIGFLQEQSWDYIAQKFTWKIIAKSQGRVILFQKI